jgi:hypothetical protein
VTDDPANYDIIPVPDRLTEAAHAFLREHRRICSFVAYVTSLATKIDHGRRIAHKALALVDKPTPEELEQSLKELDSRGAVMEMRRKYREIMLQMMLSRGVENFLTYLSEMLGTIFRARPETMRSSANVRVEEVLKYKTMDEFISHLAEKQVNQLSYQGMRELAEYLNDKMNFPILPKEQDLENAVRIIETRNLIVHNRAIVNALFLERVPSTTTAIGEPIDPEFTEVLDDITFLSQCAFFIDAKAVQKFGIETKPNPQQT